MSRVPLKTALMTSCLATVLGLWGAISAAQAKTVKVDLTAKEVMVPIDNKGNKALAWTYDGQIPGPVVRATEGDTIEFTLTNDPKNKKSHSIDFHAARADVLTTFASVKPGETKKFTFTADNPGAFFYHCGSDPMIQHIARGMIGAIIIDPIELGSEGDSEGTVLSYEFKAGINAYLASLGPTAPVKSLAELIAFNDLHRSTEMQYFGQEIFETAQKCGSLTDQKYLRALAAGHRRSRSQGIDAAVTRYRLDAIAAPTQQPPGLIDLVNGDSNGGGSATSLPAVAGYPHITVPAGYSFGLPVGLSLFGRAWSEATLIRIAFAFEQLARVRRAPRLLATADLA